MYLAIGFNCENNDTCSIGVDSYDPSEIVKELVTYGQCVPDQILLIQNDRVIEHYNRGKDYDC